MRLARAVVGILIGVPLVLAALQRAVSEPSAPAGAAAGFDAGPFASREACLGWLAAHPPGASPPRIASWNVRWFPDGGVRGPHAEHATDVEWLACAIASLGVQVVAVQEILQHPRGRRALLDLLDRLDQHTGGRWAQALDDCPGSGRQHVGLLYDSTRVKVDAPRALAELNPGDSACDRNLRPGYAAYLRFASGPDLHLITVHLDSGRTERDFHSRETSRQRLAAAVASLSTVAADADVVVLGDFNTMGCGPCEPEVDAEAERLALEQAAQGAGLRALAAQPACTHYYRGRAGLLDHVLVARGMTELAAPRPLRAAGPCDVLACAHVPRGQHPAALERLSDHCPLVLALTPRDDD